MKRVIRFLSMAIALIMIVISLFGCNKTQKDTKIPTETEASSETPTITVNGIALHDYTIVFNKKPISGAERAFSYLNKRCEELYGVSLNGEMVSKDRYEILIGLDGDSAEIKQAYDQNATGLIGATQKKIVLLGVNYAALCQVIDAFLDKATGEAGSKEISISEYEILDLNRASLNVMSYNVLMDPDKSGRPSDHSNKMVDTILANDTDVLGTQEDTSANRQYFVQKLKNYRVYKGAGEDNDGNYIYWKTDKFKVAEKGYYYLSDTPEKRSKYSDSNQYRTMTYVFLEENETGKQFLFVNTHLDYRAKEATRVKQISVLASLVKNINKDNLPLIILGDFNTTQTASGSAILHFMANNQNLGMTLDVAAKKGDIGSTLVNEFKIRGDLIFDYIFVSTDKVYTKYFSVLDNKTNGKYPSDHLPVLAQIDIY